MAGGAPYPLPAAAAGGGCATVVDAVGVNCVRGCTVCCICTQQGNAKDTQRTWWFQKRCPDTKMRCSIKLTQLVRYGKTGTPHCESRRMWWREETSPKPAPSPCNTHIKDLVAKAPSTFPIVCFRYYDKALL
jgi:hypothetical protein